MLVPDHSLLLLCSHFIESTTLRVVCREGYGNRLFWFLIVAFSSVHILLSSHLCVWCICKDEGIN